MTLQDQPVTLNRRAAPAGYEGMRLSEAFRTPTYWILSLSLAMRGMVFTSISIHVVAIMIWKGIDEGTAGLLIAGMAISWLPISLLMGWMGDRWNRKVVAGAGAIVSGVGMFGLAYLDQVAPWQMMLIFVMWAFSEGGPSPWVGHAGGPVRSQELRCAPGRHHGDLRRTRPWNAPLCRVGLRYDAELSVGNSAGGGASGHRRAAQLGHAPIGRLQARRRSLLSLCRTTWNRGAFAGSIPRLADGDA